MDKTCKSNGNLFVAIQIEISGARVRNTWATCPKARNSSAKVELKPHVANGLTLKTLKTAQAVAFGWARGLSASWRGNGSPRL